MCVGHRDVLARVPLACATRCVAPQARLARLEAMVSGTLHDDGGTVNALGESDRRLTSSSPSTASLTYDGSTVELDSNLLVRGSINATGTIAKDVVAFLACTKTNWEPTAQAGLIQTAPFELIVFNRGGGYDSSTYGFTGAFTTPLPPHLCRRR